MTLAAITGPQKPSGTSFAPVFKCIVSMSWPIMLGAVSMSVLNLGQIGILGNLTDAKPLYALSILQPYYLLFFAFLEALAITSQVFAARSQKVWVRGNVRMACLVLCLVGLVVTGGIAWLLGLAATTFAGTWPIAGADAAPLITPYLLSLIPLLVFEIVNGALRGSGRTFPGFVVLGAAVAINLAITWSLAFGEGRGLNGVVVANLASGGVAVVAALVVLRHVTRHDRPGPAVQALIRLATLFGIVGAPVFLSLVVSFASSAIMINKIADFGRQDVAAFLVVVRLRYFFLIPAIAMATSIAVLVNQDLGQHGPGDAQRSTLTNGILAILAVYLLLTATLYALCGPLVAMLVASVQVQQAAASILVTLLPSFLMVGLVASFQLILENLGRGGRVLLWTVVLEGATCATLLLRATNLEEALLVMLGAASAYTVIFGLEYGAVLIAAREASARPVGAPSAKAE